MGSLKQGLLSLEQTMKLISVLAVLGYLKQADAIFGQSYKIATKDAADDLRSEFAELYTKPWPLQKLYGRFGPKLLKTYEEKMGGDIGKLNGLLGLLDTQRNGYNLPNQRFTASKNYVINRGSPDNVSLPTKNNPQNGLNSAAKQRINQFKNRLDTHARTMKNVLKGCRRESLKKAGSSLARAAGSTAYIHKKLELTKAMSDRCTSKVLDLLKQEHKIYMEISESMFRDLNDNAKERTTILYMIEDAHEKVLNA